MVASTPADVVTGAETLKEKVAVRRWTVFGGRRLDTEVMGELL